MNLKNKFKNLKKIHGGWISLNNFQLSEIMSNLTIDFIGIDLEHTPTSIEQFLEYVSIFHAKNIKCLPRIPNLDNSLIKRLLDSGADGIIAPNIENIDQINLLNNSIKYPPNGKRGFGISKASNYGFKFNEYIKNWNNKSLLIIQIESIKGVENLENLLLHGNRIIDGVMIGPYDISGSLGIPGQINHVRVKKACNKIISICKKHKKACGIHDTDPGSNSLNNFFKDGYNFVIAGSDIFTLWRWVEKINKLIKAS